MGVLLSILITIAFVLFALVPVQVLILRDAIDQTPVFMIPIDAGQIFTLKFLHSYEKGWVSETFRVHPQGYFYLTEHEFQVFNYDDREDTYRGDISSEGGYIKVAHIERYQEVKFTSLPIRTANIVPQMIEVEGKVVSLPDLVAGGTLLMLEVQRVKRYQDWAYRLQQMVPTNSRIIRDANGK